MNCRDQKSTRDHAAGRLQTGFTLVEMLVATAATLILMGAVAQMFAVFGDAIRGSRATLGLDGRLRNTAWRLRTDLAGATARMSPPLSPDSSEGYFEIIEGPLSDYQDASDPPPALVSDSNSPLPLVSGATAIGPTDIDDAILFTTRNTETPFIGRAPTAGAVVANKTDTFESTVAEVAWFARVTPGTANPVTYTLYRKQLLVIGYVGADPFTLDNQVDFSPYGSWAGYYNAPCDVSVRREASPPGTSPAFDTLLPNSLADLTRRESRFLHNPDGLTATGFPFAFVAHQTPSTSSTSEVLPTGLSGLIFDSTSQRYGEDVVLDNVIAFDVRVFDAAAPVYVATGGTPLVPGDPGFTNTPVASGAYVDLGHGVTTNSLLTGVGVVPHFAGYGDTRSGLAGSASSRRTYDTWSTHYEADGRDSDGDGPFDEGTDGLDNDGDGIIDDPDIDKNADGIIDATDPEELGEAETAAPYPHTLRGIEVRIRCYEPSSRQVRQVTVRHTFVPH